MSSSAGIQNLLVNVFRPVYTYDSNTGIFTPTLQLANVAYSGTTISVSNAAIGDGNQNVYVGSNAGNSFLDLRACDNNTALGFSAGGLISNVSNSVYLGYNAGNAASNASNVIAIGSNTGGNGNTNIFLGSETGSTGSNNILIGHSIAGGASNNLLRIGSTLYGNLASRWVGIGTDTSTSGTNFDVSGVLTASTIRMPNGTAAAPAYSFTSDTGLGVYRAGASQLGFASDGIQRMVLSNGFVGIGTSAPLAILDVRDASATIRVSDTQNRQPTIELNRSGGAPFGTSGLADWRIQITQSGGNYQLVRSSTTGGITTTTTPFFIDGPAGNTGINTTSPGYPLDVSGTIRGSNLLVAGYLRDALTSSQFDISGGNISNSGSITTNRVFTRNLYAPSTSDVSAISYINMGTAVDGGSGSSSSNLQFLWLRSGGAPLRYAGINYGNYNSGSFMTYNNGGSLVTKYINAVPTAQSQLDACDSILTLTSSGRVGVGTSTPTRTLEVSGDAHITGILSAGAFDISSGGIASSNLVISGYLRNAVTPTQFDISGGNISNSATLTTSNIRAGAPGNTAVTAIQEFGRGSDALVAGFPAIAFQYRDSAGGYRHFIRTRHDSAGATSGNAIDFFTNTSGVPATSTAPGTGNVLAMAVTSVGVGIGTPSPVVALDVSGRALIVADGSSSLTNFGVGVDTLVLQQRGSYMNTADLGKSTSILFSNAHAGFAQARIVSEMTGVSNGAYGANLIFQTNAQSGNLAERMRIHSNGNVGIGTPTPTRTLDVSGTFKVAGGNGLFDVSPDWGTYANVTMNGYFNVYRSGTTDKAASNVYVNFGPEPGSFHYLLSNNVGIHTRDPSHTLDVVGTIRGSNLLTNGYIRNALTPSQFDISGGNIRAVGNITAEFGNITGARLITSTNGSIGDMAIRGPTANLGIYFPSTSTIAFATPAVGEVFRIGDFGISNGSTYSNTLAGVVLSNNNISNSGTTTSGGVIAPYFRDSASAASRNIDISLGTFAGRGIGNVTALTSFPLLVDSGGNGAGLFMEKGANNDQVGYSFRTRPNGATTERFRIHSTNGFVGIGTSAPVTSLDVRDPSGTIRVTDTGGNGNPGIELSRTAGATFGSAGITDWRMQTSAGNYQLIYARNNVAVTPFFISGVAGNVGIGKTAPSTTLDVSGSFQVTDRNAYFEAIPAIGDYGNVTMNGYFNIYPPGTTSRTNQAVRLSPEPGSFHFLMNNNVGIRTRDPSLALDVVGTIRGSSNIVAVRTATYSMGAGWNAISAASYTDLVSLAYTPKQTGNVTLIVEGKIEVQMTSSGGDDGMNLRLTDGVPNELAFNLIYTALGQNVLYQNNMFNPLRFVGTFSGAQTFKIQYECIGGSAFQARRGLITVYEVSQI